jgi:hypothetical protein
MKWIKLFESFRQILSTSSEYDVDYIEDVCLTLNDYNLKLSDVSEGSAREMPKNNNIVTNINDFDNSMTYKSLVLNIKTIEGDSLINKESFYEDLDDIIHHLESKFNLKLECIFFNEGMNKFGLGLVYYRFLEDFKRTCLFRYPISSGKNIQFIRFEIMFKKLNP